MKEEIISEIRRCATIIAIGIIFTICTVNIITTIGFNQRLNSIETLIKLKTK